MFVICRIIHTSNRFADEPHIGFYVILPGVNAGGARADVRRRVGRLSAISRTLHSLRLTVFFALDCSCNRYFVSNITKIFRFFRLFSDSLCTFALRQAAAPAGIKARGRPARVRKTNNYKP